MDEKNSSIKGWIVSLAISVVICAVFVGYVFDIKADIKHSQLRDDILEQRIDMLKAQVDSLRQHEKTQDVEIVPPPPHANIQLPETTVPPAQPQPSLPQPGEAPPASAAPPPSPAPATGEPPQPQPQPPK